LHRRYSQALLTVDMLVRGLELKVDFLLSFEILSAGDVEVKGDGLVAIDAS